MPIKQVRLRAALDAYYAESSRFLSYAESTQRAYRASLEALYRVCGSSVRAYELSTEHLEKTLVAREQPDPEDNARRARIGIKQRGVRGPRAKANDVKAFKSFIKFCHEREYMSYARNPAGHMSSNPPASNRTANAPIEDMIVQPNEEVFDKLLDAAGKRHPRDRMVVALGLFTALRQSEMLALKIKGIDFQKTTKVKGKTYAAPEIRVWRKKTKDWHRVPMVNRMREEALRYLAWFDRTNGTLHPELFVLGTRRSGLEGVRRDGKFLADPGKMTADTPLDATKTPRQLEDDVQAAFQNAGFPMPYRCGVHTLRRMAAVWAEENSDDPNTAQYLLGHKSRQTTEIYLQHGDRERRLRVALHKMGGGGEALDEPEEERPSNVVPLRPRRSVA